MEFPEFPEGLEDYAEHLHSLGTRQERTEEESEIAREFGEKLVSLREKRELEQEELARKSRLNEGRLWVLEKGVFDPKRVEREDLDRLRDILGEEADELWSILGREKPDRGGRRGRQRGRN